MTLLQMFAIREREREKRFSRIILSGEKLALLYLMSNLTLSDLRAAIRTG